MGLQRGPQRPGAALAATERKLSCTGCLLVLLRSLGEATDERSAQLQAVNNLCVLR